MLSKAKIEKLRSRLKRNQNDFSGAYRALGDSRRHRMFVLIAQHSGLCVTEIARIFEISLPAASQHLKILKHAGIVIGERFGQTMCYEINKRNPLTKALLHSAEKITH